MRAVRAASLALVVTTVAAGPLAAQGSGFAVSGLGWLGRPVSARSAGAAGSLGVVDPAMNLNPAALARWRSVAGWAVGSPTSSTFDGPAGQAALRTTRFPVFGFAAVLPGRAAVSLSVSDYLDRSYQIQRKDTMVLRGQAEPFQDAARSLGGVSDMQLGVGYRLKQSLSVGLAFHYYLGSARLTSQRVFDNTAYQQVLEQSTTDYHGVGIGAGVLAALSRRLEVGVSGRLNGRLRSENTGGGTAETRLPAELAAGARLVVVPGVSLAGTAQWAGWSRASQDLTEAGRGPARDVWSLSGGAEVESVTLLKIRTPLRIGYRWRQLPFPFIGEHLSEKAASVGFGWTLSRDRTNVDLAVEHGRREGQTTSETFTTLFVGLVIRP